MDGQTQDHADGNGYRWYRVDGLDYLLRRTGIDGTDKPNLKTARVRLAVGPEHGKSAVL
jgi:hypothetical protein